MLVNIILPDMAERQAINAQESITIVRKWLDDLENGEHTDTPEVHFYLKWHERDKCAIRGDCHALYDLIEVLELFLIDMPLQPLYWYRKNHHQRAIVFGYEHNKFASIVSLGHDDCWAIASSYDTIAYVVGSSGRAAQWLSWLAAANPVSACSVKFKQLRFTELWFLNLLCPGDLRSQLNDLLCHHSRRVMDDFQNHCCAIDGTRLAFLNDTYNNSIARGNSHLKALTHTAFR